MVVSMIKDLSIVDNVAFSGSHVITKPIVFVVEGDCVIVLAIMIEKDRKRCSKCNRRTRAKSGRDYLLICRTPFFRLLPVILCFGLSKLEIHGNA